MRLLSGQNCAHYIFSVKQTSHVWRPNKCIRNLVYNKVWVWYAEHSSYGYTKKKKHLFKVQSRNWCFPLAISVFDKLKISAMLIINVHLYTSFVLKLKFRVEGVLIFFMKEHFSIFTVCVSIKLMMQIIRVKTQTCIFICAWGNDTSYGLNL